MYIYTVLKNNHVYVQGGLVWACLQGSRRRDFLYTYSTFQGMLSFIKWMGFDANMGIRVTASDLMEWI